MENNLEIEQSIIASLIKISDPSSDLIGKAFGIIKESSFSNRNHKTIFRAIKTITAKNQYLDLITVSDLCAKLDSTAEDFFVYLANVLNNNISSANIIAHCKLLREQAIERFALSKLNEAIGMFGDKSNGDVYQRLGLAESYLNEIGNMSMRNEKGGLKHVSETAGDWLDNIEQIQRDGFDKNKFTTGVESLDDVFGIKGMRRGSLVAIGARPKMGKTALLSLMANHFSLNLKLPVAVFSMEMPSVEIFERGISGRTLMSAQKMYAKDVDMSSDVMCKRNMAFNEYMQSNLYIEDTPALSLKHIQKECRQLRKEQGEMGLICVDYLTLMEAEKADRNDLAYGMITKGLKNLAKELNCVVLMLTQLNRGLENRTDKRPMPSDSRDTGQIEQDVDLWLGLYKDSVYNEEVQDPWLTEVIVRLNRHGGTGTGFVRMNEGYHTPVSFDDGVKILNKRNMNKQDSESAERDATKFTKKRQAK
jgi:replicative DNA helicase